MVNKNECTDAADQELFNLSPRQFESTFVHDVYTDVAEHFSHTRYKPWPGVRNFINSLPAGSIVLDAGCGNGKYLHLRKDITVIGSDRCAKLLEFCSRPTDALQVGGGPTHILSDNKHSDCNARSVLSATDQASTVPPTSERTDVESHWCPDVYTADCRKLFVRSASFDAVMSIAVLHHIPDKRAREDALREHLRCVKIGGQVLIFVWAFEQSTGTIGSRKFESQDVLVPWKKPIAKKKKDHSSTDSGEALTTFHRYYHVFQRREVECLCESVSDMAFLRRIDFEANNWSILLERSFLRIKPDNECA
eukprot:Lankesteria_metandrocarpae@DN4088_c0_g1_i1.p1